MAKGKGNNRNGNGNGNGNGTKNPMRSIFFYCVIFTIFLVIFYAVNLSNSLGWFTVIQTYTNLVFFLIVILSVGCLSRYLYHSKHLHLSFISIFLSGIFFLVFILSCCIIYMAYKNTSANKKELFLPQSDNFLDISILVLLAGYIIIVFATGW